MFNILKIEKKMPQRKYVSMKVAYYTINVKFSYIGRFFFKAKSFFNSVKEFLLLKPMGNIPSEEAFIFVLFEFVYICVSDNNSHHLLTHVCVQRGMSLLSVEWGGLAPLWCANWKGNFSAHFLK